MNQLEKSHSMGWNFDNSYANLSDMFYTETEPEQVKSPKLIIFNSSLADSLGLDTEKLENHGTAVFAGNEIPPNSTPIAQAYAGHQFGNFTMLGDGRAVMLGEQITPSGERFDIQLKGAGRTPYSRGGDGRATLGPMLREYIISEAMDKLGIPTTRSLAVVTTGEPVLREKPLLGAVLTRVAASHIRVGTFQYAANWGTKEELRALADYTIERHFPALQEAEKPYVALLEEVIKRQAQLIAKWQLVGFIHGVMNTDNMTISGETIDYGPCAFMDEYDPATVFSSIDREGRYAYQNQPGIGMWNLTRFAEALLRLFADEEDQAIEIAKESLSTFPKRYEEAWLAGMYAKLGITNPVESDRPLIGNLLQIMEKYKVDYTNTFRGLTLQQPEDTGLMEKAEFKKWYEDWGTRIKGSEKEARELMQKSNPAVIPRNHRVEEALDAAVEKGDYSVMERLLGILENPYAYSPEQEEYATPPKPTKIPYQTFCGT